MTTALTLRATKGSALTHNEMDTNLTNLQTTADDALAATATLTADKAEATALGVANTDQNMGSFTGATIPDNVSAKAGMQALETAVEAKTNAVATRAAMAALAVASRTSAVLHESGREGLFHWSSADLSAAVTADPAQGIHVAPSTDTTGASGAWVRVTDGTWLAEWFGAVGDGVTNDTAALEAMGDYGAECGFIHWHALPGKVYTYTNPSFLAGIAGGVKISGYGSAVQNIRATLGLPLTYYGNAECLGFPAAFSTNSREIYDGGATPFEFGQLIETAARGDTTITLQSGEVSQMVVGKRALVYGFSRQTTGFPPNPVYFQRVLVTGISGQDITFEPALEHNYYSDWPAIVTGTDFTGAPRMLSLSRPRFEEIASIEIDGLRFKADPNWAEVDGGTINRNGRTAFGGYRKCRLRDTIGEGGCYPSEGGDFSESGASWRGGHEIDKVMDSFTADDGCDFAEIAGGTGCKRITYRNSKIRLVGPVDSIDLLQFDACEIDSAEINSATIISGTFGAAVIEAKNCIIGAEQSSNSRVFATGSRSFAITVIDTTTIDMDIALFISSSLYRNIREDSVLYTAAGEPAFRCTSTPREAAGRVFITGISYRTLVTGDVLHCPIYPALRTSRNRIIGTYRRPVVSVAPPGIVVSYGVFEDDSSRPGTWSFNSSLAQLSTTSRYFQPGFLVYPSRMIITVSKAYTGATVAPLLRVKLQGAGVNIALIDLLTVGTRSLDISGAFGALGTDTLTGLTTAAIASVEYRADAPIVYATEDEAAVWAISFEGTQVAG